MSVCIIPARGGSRRIPRKNIKLFHGKPIIAYSIETALQSGIFDRVIVSTEDREIAETAARYGAELNLRPARLADDDIGTQEVAQQVLRDLDDVNIKYACVLYATAPMLRTDTLEAAYELLASNQHRGTNYVVPVATWLRDPGQFYFGTTQAFLSGRPLLSRWTTMLPIDPSTECDINTPEDWERAERMYLKFKEVA